MKKTFVLDTNVLLHNPACLEVFSDNIVVIPMAVIEELDTFKARHDELGRNARTVIRRLDALRARGRLGEGVPTGDGGMLKIIMRRGPEPDMDLNMEMPDNRIVRIAYRLHQNGDPVIFVSKDINARLKADALGIQAMDFEKQKVKFDELFTGYREVQVSGDVVDRFYKEKHLELPELDAFPNEFVMLKDEVNPKHTGLARVKDQGDLIALNPRFETAWNVRPRSREQRMAMELLLDNEILVVTLVGQAGTGKTLLALAAALDKVVHQHKYEKILVSRPILPLGKDLGYLPGDKDDKLKNWMQPIFDNLDFLMSLVNAKDKKKSPRDRVKALVDESVVEMEAVTYIRGRSIPKQFMIVDEAQNLTPHEVKTIVSRAGEGTKVVLTGDPYQIDNPYLDASSNGLTYAVDRLKTQTVHGHVTLAKSERSRLAALAAELL